MCVGGGRRKSTHWRLNGAVEVGKEGMATAKGQHSALNHGALHVIVLQHHVLLQGLDGKELPSAFELRQHHLKHSARKGIISWQVVVRGENIQQQLICVVYKQSWEPG